MQNRHTFEAVECTYSGIFATILDHLEESYSVSVETFVKYSSRSERDPGTNRISMPQTFFTLASHSTFIFHHQYAPVFTANVARGTNASREICNRIFAIGEERDTINEIIQYH